MMWKQVDDGHCFNNNNNHSNNNKCSDATPGMTPD